MAKKLIKGYTNKEVAGQENPYQFLSNIDITSIQDKELRIAVQSYKLAKEIIDSHMISLKNINKSVDTPEEV
jgi:hypothetical protein